MCKYHSDPRASQNIANVIEQLKTHNEEVPRDLCTSATRELLQPVWRDHMDFECYPIAVMEILDESGNYRPAATLKLQGDPLKGHMPLHFRVDYTIRIPKSRGFIDNLFRRTGQHLAMGHLRGYDSEALTEMAASGLGKIIYIGANKAHHDAMQQCLSWPTKKSKT